LPLPGKGKAIFFWQKGKHDHPFALREKKEVVSLLFGKKGGERRTRTALGGRKKKAFLWKGGKK